MNRIPVLTVRSFFWIGLTALAFGVFIDITKDMLEGEVGFLDQSILLAIGKIRAPWMTVAAVDLTALGSVTLVCLFSAFTVITSLMLHDKAGTLQLLSALGGAALWTALTKHTIERTRPEVIPHLVEVSGYSYPSGHSLVAASAYMTIAILACRHLHSARARGVNDRARRSLAPIWECIIRRMSPAASHWERHGHLCLPESFHSKGAPQTFKLSSLSLEASGLRGSSAKGVESKQHSPDSRRMGTPSVSRSCAD